ncbi:hypothetical protein CEXT_732841 [Caerostris extrusa]|uniref:Uncharacterized protein n=1 Tax=Caerostris extrusa TaxID=172846 RepID=A0AAV4QY75_CAEEX|nr:hypothetical protein CEXT_732841 [Caerostris extrusa]
MRSLHPSGSSGGLPAVALTGSYSLKYQEATREGREIRTKRKRGVISSSFTAAELEDFEGALVCPSGKSPENVKCR